MTAIRIALSDFFHPHNAILVLLSYLLAVFASYVAMELAGRIKTSSDDLKWVWLGFAAVAMGGGIWSMHFVAMLGIILPFPVTYDVSLTLLSLVIPIAVTGVGLYIVFWNSQSFLGLGVGNALMGGGVVAMHYTGMSAMDIPVETTYSGGLVGLSVIIAGAASMAALWLVVKATTQATKLLSAMVMGAAIAGMHLLEWPPSLVDRS